MPEPFVGVVNMYKASHWESGTKVWTGYPFVELGDEPGKKAVIREVEFVSYDNNKYCEVKLLPEGNYSEQTSSVKAGYLFETFEECDMFENNHDLWFETYYGE